MFFFILSLSVYVYRLDPGAVSSDEEGLREAPTSMTAQQAPTVKDLLHIWINIFTKRFDREGGWVSGQHPRFHPGGHVRILKAAIAFIIFDFLSCVTGLN